MGINGEREFSPIHRFADSPVRVLVVDDSSFMRKAITQILSSVNRIKVVDTAENGVEAVRKVKELHPDVVLLDIEMPMMDGLAALAHIMAESPTPVLMLSAMDKKDHSIILKSMQYGAVDYISKPSGVISYDIDRLRDEIVEKTNLASGANVVRIPFASPEESFLRETRPSPKDMVVIGASTGGPRAIATIISGIKGIIPASVLVVQHMGKELIPFFAEQLRWYSAMSVSIAEEGEPLTPGTVLVAPGGCNTGVKLDVNKRVIGLGGEAAKGPSIDYAMESAAKVYGDRILGVLLTGAGSDGAKGMKAIKGAGGATIAEDQSTCMIFGMPKAAIEAGCVDRIVPLSQIAGEILRMI